MSAKRIDKIFKDLFPILRSITGEGNRETLLYIKNNILPTAEIKSISSGTKVYDWIIPPEWKVNEAYVKNKFGKKIIDIKENNLHLVSYSISIKGIFDKKDLLKKIYTLPNYPDWIPYRTTYYKDDWGFCCTNNLIESEEFIGPFEVNIDTDFNENGELNWLECFKEGSTNEEILISTYCCHPNLANDNLSGLVAASLLFEYLKDIKTKYSYRLVIVPETIGAITFLSQTEISKICGGMILSCVGGPGLLSIKEGFDNKHWINKAAIESLETITKGNFLKYPFIPDGSDERQYSSPGVRIITPSIHKSKYYEYPEYHTSGDNLDFISSNNLDKTMDVYKEWIRNIESYCFPERINLFCEYQLGKRDLYPNLGGDVNVPSHSENIDGNHERKFNFNKDFQISGQHLEAFNWIMHLADGQNSNFEIAEKSGLPLKIINESLALFYKKNLIKLK